jgi:hypothetical protein
VHLLDAVVRVLLPVQSHDGLVTPRLGGLNSYRNAEVWVIDATYRLKELGVVLLNRTVFLVFCTPLDVVHTLPVTVIE